MRKKLFVIIAILFNFSMGNCMVPDKGKKKNYNKINEPSLKPAQKQGAKELKQNYHIDNSTKVLGSGAFGKVFLTYNKHDANH